MSKIREYLIKTLTAMGQMNHVNKGFECEKGHRVVCQIPGVMTMPVETRRELLDEGWKLVDEMSIL